MRPTIEGGGPDPSIVSSLAKIARKIGRAEQAVDLIRSSLASASLHPRQRVDLLFRLGDLRDAAGEWDAAFEAYAEANSLQRSLFRYDSVRGIAAVDEVIAGWPSGRALPRASVASSRPVFIVGMTRSGTSLVEQVLASHPDVAPGGELQDIAMIAHQWQGGLGGDLPVFTRPEELTRERLDQAARRYLARLDEVDRRAARVTDKLPINFLNLGLIGLLFPAARVIHCVRDRMDTCLSCYFQNFGGFMPFAYDLAELGAFYRAYERLMAHWETVLEIQRVVAPYEAMVADQEGASRSLVGFVGLGWDERCLRFYESKRVVMTSSNDQVRRPVYASSVGRWRRYEKHLGPLREALGA
jgi:hypothetical protein